MVKKFEFSRLKNKSEKKTAGFLPIGSTWKELSKGMFQTLDSSWQFVSKLVESQCKCLIAPEWQWRLAFKLQLKLSVRVRSCLIAFSKISTLLAVDRCTKESEPPKSRILHPLTDLTTLFCCFAPTQRKNSSINKVTFWFHFY